MNIQFQEVQYFPTLVFVIVVGIVFHLLWLNRRVPLTISITICVFLASILLLFFQQKTELDDEAVRIQFGWIPLIQQTIPLEAVTRQRILTYLPMDHSWGLWQDVKDISPFVPGGEESLLLELSNGSRYLLATRRIKELQRAIEYGRKKSGDTK